MARNYGSLPSELVDIEDGAAALDFNRACNLRLLKFDNERNAANLEVVGSMICSAMGVSFTGSGDGGDGGAHRIPTGNPDEDYDVW